MINKPMRFIILIPTLLALTFAGLFGWAVAQNTKVRSECVKIRLITNVTETTRVSGLFIDGIECKFDIAIPETCKPYYTSVPECPRARRRLSTDDNSGGNIGNEQSSFVLVSDIIGQSAIGYRISMLNSGLLATQQ